MRRIQPRLRDPATVDRLYRDRHRAMPDVVAFHLTRQMQQLRQLKEWMIEDPGFSMQPHRPQGERGGTAPTRVRRPGGRYLAGDRVAALGVAGPADRASRRQMIARSAFLALWAAQCIALNCPQSPSSVGVGRGETVG